MSSADPSDDLHDAALAEDIALLGDMMAAAAADAGHSLTDAEVDHALGLPEPALTAEPGKRRQRRRDDFGRQSRRARRR